MLGVDGGQSDAIFFDGMGRQILNLSIRVDAPTDELSDTMHRLFPNARIDVQSMNGHVILSGMAQDDGQADQILRLAQTYVDKPENVVNLMSIAGKDQVTLKVRVVEVNRTTIKQLGFNTNLLTGQAGGVQYSIGQQATFGVNNKYLGSMSGGYSQDTTTQPTVTINNPDGSTSTVNAQGVNPTTGQAVVGLTSGLAGSSGLNKLSSQLEAFERVGPGPHPGRTEPDRRLRRIGQVPGRRRVPRADRPGQPGPHHGRVQAVRRRPRLHAGRRPHQPEDFHRSVGTVERRFAAVEQHPDHPRPERAPRPKPASRCSRVRR